MKHIIVITAAVAVSAGCGDPNRREKLKIGSIYAVTGGLANIGTSQLEAARMAAEAINAKGGVLGKDLEIVHRDDATNAETAKTALQGLINTEKIQVALGSSGSGSMVAAGSIAKDNRVVLFSASATSPEITTFADDGYLWRTCPSDYQQGKLLAKKAWNNSHDRVSIIHLPGAYGTGFASAFTQAFNALGGTVAATREYMEGAADFSTLLGQTYADNSDAVILIGYVPDGQNIVNRYLAAPPGTPLYWYFTDGLEDPSFATDLDQSAFNHLGTGPTSGSAEFKATYRAKYGKDPFLGSFASHAYDAVYLTALAIQAAGKHDGAAIRDQLVGVSSGGTKFRASQFGEAVAALNRGEDIDFVGESGVVDLGADGDLLAPYEYDVWKVSGSPKTITIVEEHVTP